MDKDYSGLKMINKKIIINKWITKILLHNHCILIKKIIKYQIKQTKINIITLTCKINKFRKKLIDYYNYYKI